MKHFIITNNIEHFRESTVLPLDQEKTSTLRGFYEEMARVLEFPDYFSFNLDSLDEMLNDLSWLEDEKIVIFVQNSAHFLSKERNAKKVETIFDLLDASCEDWQWAEEDDERPKKSLNFVFDDSPEIRQLLKKSELEFDIL